MSLPEVQRDPQAQALPLVAMVGNPNTGKSSVFNALTGSAQRVANYPGVTVERVSGKLAVEGAKVELLDVPGLYSLEALSEDERVAVDVIRGASQTERRPDLLLCVMDAPGLERNLYLFTELADLDAPLLVAVTKTDQLEAEDKRLDVARLSSLLDVDVVPVVGFRGRGIEELKSAISRNLERPRIPDLEIEFSPLVEFKVALLKERLARAGFDVPKANVRRGLLGEDPEFARSVEDFPEIKEAFDEAVGEIQKSQAAQRQDATPEERYQWAEMVTRAAIERDRDGRPKSTSDKIDSWLTHRVFGLLFFVALMYLVFQSIYTLAQPLMAGIEWAFGKLGEWTTAPLSGAPWLQSLVSDGLLGGVGTMLMFLPQICILFLFIGILEGTGYLARAAFLMDRLLGWCGLNGRAFIPLLSSFACAVPGIMAARVMPDRKSRLATILVAPLMSCSARLPVYVLLIGTFIEPQFGAGWAGFALFAMHVLGLIVAVPVAWVLNRGVLRGSRLPFLLELPPYEWPKPRDVWLGVYFRGKVFVKTAGTIIVALSIVIWSLAYFPRSPELEDQLRAQISQADPSLDAAGVEVKLSGELLARSYLGQFGKAIEPAFLPAGFDWRLSTAIISAFPAREVMVSTLGIIFNVSSDVDETSTDLRSVLRSAKWPDGRPLANPWTAVGLMVFFALCAQCMSTLATIRRETNSWGWPVFVFVYMSGLAYLGAVGVHQLSLAFG